MKRVLFPILPILLMIPVSAMGSGSIGYVDMQVVLDKSKMGQQAQQLLKEKFAGRQQEFSEEEQAIRRFQQTLARDQALMSQEELDKKTADIQERLRTFQQKTAQAQQELLQEQNKLASQILEPAQAIIAAVAKGREVSAVFERRQSGLLYVDEALDLTAEVVKRLDAQESE